MVVDLPLYWFMAYITPQPGQKHSLSDSSSLQIRTIIVADWCIMSMEQSWSTLDLASHTCITVYKCWCNWFKPNLLGFFCTMWWIISNDSAVEYDHWYPNVQMMTREKSSTLPLHQMNYDLTLVITLINNALMYRDLSLSFCITEDFQVRWIEMRIPNKNAA